MNGFTRRTRTRQKHHLQLQLTTLYRFEEKIPFSGETKLIVPKCKIKLVVVALGTLRALESGQSGHITYFTDSGSGLKNSLRFPEENVAAYRSAGRTWNTSNKMLLAHLQKAAGNSALP